MYAINESLLPCKPSPWDQHLETKQQHNYILSCFGISALTHSHSTSHIIVSLFFLLIFTFLPTKHTGTFSTISDTDAKKKQKYVPIFDILLVIKSILLWDYNTAKHLKDITVTM